MGLINCPVTSIIFFVYRPNLEYWTDVFETSERNANLRQAISHKNEDLKHNATVKPKDSPDSF
jgi:hypothetical protein